MFNDSNILRYGIWLGVSGCAASLAVAEGSAAVEWAATTMWESRYIDSGREDLDDSGIFSGELIGSLDEFSFGAWLGVADSEGYEELNLFAAYGFQFGDVAVEVGYTHLEFASDSENDDELSIAAEVEVLGGFIVGVSGVYSFEAEGSFVEISLAYPLAFFDERLWLVPSVHEGFDYGYRSESHDGPNHVQISVDLEYRLTESTALVGYVAHSVAQDDVEREDLGDVSWFGLGLNTQF
ncbi:MAG: hypothetical protein ACI9FZ_000140 [Bacteroidia bacterium]|jgi:hypothetical protein